MSRTSSGISIHRSWLTSCLISSIGKSGARSWGPMGWPVPGCSGGGSGVLKSAWMLYHLVGISFSESRYFVVMSAGFRAMTFSFAEVKQVGPRRVLGQLELADGCDPRAAVAEAHVQDLVPAAELLHWARPAS